MSPDIHTLTGAYATHSLPEWEEREFQAHLADCAACAAEVAELEGTTARIGAALATPPPPELKARVMAQINQTRQLPPLERRESATPDAPPAADIPSVGDARGAPDAVPDADDTVASLIPGIGTEPTPLVPRAARRPRRRWAQVLAAAASVVLLVAVAVLGANNVSLRNQVDDLEAQRQTVEQILAAPDAVVSAAEAEGRSGRVVVAPSQESGVFFASGLAAAPAGQTYQGWLINSETDIRSAGLFLPNADGTAVLVVTGDLQAAQAFAITLEPDGGSAQPTVLPPLLAVPLQA